MNRRRLSGTSDSASRMYLISSVSCTRIICMSPAICFKYTAASCNSLRSRCSSRSSSAVFVVTRLSFLLLQDAFGPIGLIELLRHTLWDTHLLREARIMRSTRHHPRLGHTLTWHFGSPLSFERQYRTFP